MKKATIILLIVVSIMTIGLLGCPKADETPPAPTAAPATLTTTIGDGTYTFTAAGGLPFDHNEIYININEAIAIGDVITISANLSGLSAFKQIAIQANLDGWSWPPDGSTAKVWANLGFVDGTNLTAVITTTVAQAAGFGQFKFQGDNLVVPGDFVDTTITIANLTVTKN